MPAASGRGGQSIYGAPFRDEIVAHLKHNGRGTVSCAAKGANNNAAQFFIAYTALPHLDNVNTIFARVIDGFDVLDTMERAAVDAKFRPLTPIAIRRTIIHANPLAS